MESLLAVDEAELPTPSCSPSESAAPSAIQQVSPSSVFTDYQDFYTQRVQNLERFKERVCHDSVLAARQENGSRGGSCADSNQNFENKFGKLQENMVALMEKDVTLMRQLLALNETVEELKIWNLSPASSMASLLLEDDVEASISSTTNSVSQFLVSDSPQLQQKQYFSRKNSVLRIPIPPNHNRNRSKTVGSFGSVDDGDDSSSGISSNSRGSSGTNYSRPPSLIRNGPHQKEYLNEEYEDNLSPLGFVLRSKSNKGVVRHESQASVDSGIHLANGENDKEEVFV